MLWTASAFNVRMELQPEAIRMGESAQLSIVIEGADRPPQPEAPSVQGLRISGPAVEQSFSMTTVNGRMQQQRSVTYRYTIIPLQPGEYTLGPLNYTYENQNITVPARTLRVVIPGGGEGGHVQELSDLVFAELTVDRSQVYVQDLFTLTIAIYSRGVNLGRDVSLVNMPDSGIQTQPFQELRATREVVRNDIYDVRRYQTQVRPLTSGSIRFAPGLRIQLLVPRAQQRRQALFDDPFFSGIFSNMEAHPFDLTLSPVEVEVRPLPDTDRPASFTGGVGAFRFEVLVQEAEVRPGDPITVTMVIDGEGNMDAVSAPALVDSDLFRVYPPRVTQSDVDRAGFRGRRVFEQVVIPRTSESVALPPVEFSYFDPRKGRYETISRGPITLNLREGDAVAPRVVRADGASPDHRARIVGQDIRYIKAAPTNWQRVDVPAWHASGWFMAVQTVPLIILATVFVWARRRRALDADVALARRYRAPRSARAGLRQAEAAAARPDEDAFFNGLWAALTGYFGDRLNLASGAVTSDEVVPALRARGVDEATLTHLQRLFDVCEQRRFGRVATPPDQMQALLDTCRDVLKSCERVRA